MFKSEAVAAATGFIEKLQKRQEHYHCHRLHRRENDRQPIPYTPAKIFTFCLNMSTSKEGNPCPVSSSAHDTP